TASSLKARSNRRRFPFLVPIRHLHPEPPMLRISVSIKPGQAQYFEEVGRELPDRIQLLSYTKGFDDYYFFATGMRDTRAEKPRQRMDPAFRRLLRAVAESGLPYRVSAAMALLELADDARRKFLGLVDEARRTHRREHRLVDASMYCRHGGGWGVTIMLDTDPVRLGLALERFGPRKKEELHLATWYGIGVVPGKTDRIVVVQYLKESR
ncbi:MAG: hypothetical protein ACHQ4J_13820, partial [Candidatus Binatia bacterium]